jgi:hypothetical protein
MKEECMGNKAKQDGGMGKGPMERLPRSPESSPGLRLGFGLLRYHTIGVREIIGSSDLFMYNSKEGFLCG